MWRKRGSALGALQARVAQMSVEDVPGHNLCKNVRWILVALDLVELEVAAAQVVLHPELADRQVVGKTIIRPDL